MNAGASSEDGSHEAPTVTHCLISGQQTCGDGQAALSAGSHMVPGATGVKQCFASGQQNSVDLHSLTGVHGCEAVTHSLVNGQQICPAEHAFASLAQEVPVGVRQAFASGQQNSVEEHGSVGVQHELHGNGLSWL